MCHRLVLMRFASGRQSGVNGGPGARFRGHCAGLHAGIGGTCALGAGRRVWLHFSLAALDMDLRVVGSRLVIPRQPTLAALNMLMPDSGDAAVYRNQLYDPSAFARDKRIKHSLKSDGIRAESFNAALLHDPWVVAALQGFYAILKEGSGYGHDRFGRGACRIAAR